MKKAMLVYQADIANVFEVDTFSLDSGKRNARRVLQHAFVPCEYFVRGLEAAGVKVTVAYCYQAGDITHSRWSLYSRDAPFRYSFGKI